MNTMSVGKNGKSLQNALESLRYTGYAVVEGLLETSLIRSTREAMYRAQEAILRDVGEERLRRAGEKGVLRLMMKYEPDFFKFLEIPEMLAVIDNTVSETAILHLQNGFILPSSSREETSAVFQHIFHPDFYRVPNAYLRSINVIFTIDECSAANGGTLVVPGPHQRNSSPSQEYLKENAIAME